MDLIEKLISEPTEETIELLFEDDTEVFWVDWKEDDSALTDYCESIANSKNLSSYWEGDKLMIKFGDASKEVPLTQSGADRHVTLMTINEILASSYEIRMVWDSDGGDTLAFTILPTEKWTNLESLYGADQVDKAFLKLSTNLNTFTDSLSGRRPGEKIVNGGNFRSNA